jgi:methylmalonyl-CoA mutase N-terminal domain/subunit
LRPSRRAHPAAGAGCGLRGPQAIDSGEQVIVGVNRYQTNDPVDQSDADRSRWRTAEIVCRPLSAARDAAAWKSAIEAIRTAATGGSNLVPPIVAAVEARATLGEIADALRQVFGEFRDSHA